MSNGRTVEALDLIGLRFDRALLSEVEGLNANGLNQCFPNRRNPMSRLTITLDDSLHHLWALMACEPSVVLVTGDRLLQENPRPGGWVTSPAGWAGDFRA
jgi:hypothetical protein